MHLKRLAHVCMPVIDLEKIRVFYCDILKCRVIHEFVNKDHQTYGLFIYINNDSFLEFFRSSDESNSQANPNQHICFEVGDIQEWVAWLESNGYKPNVRRGRTDRVLQFEITDPESNILEFHQYDTEAVQFQYLGLDLERDEGK